MNSKLRRIKEIIAELEPNIEWGVDMIRKNHSVDEQLEIFEFMIEKLRKAQNQTGDVDDKS